jgi:nitrogenase molybdenum-iron protein beta chain
MSNLIEQPRYSCALGVQQSVVAIRRAVPVVHAGPGCSVKIQSLIGQGEGYAGGSTIPCTNMCDSEVVFGGEGRLRSVLDGAFQVVDADLFVVLTGCTSDIIGDDVPRVVAEYQQAGRPVVFAETGGFKSSNYVSHSLVVNAIVDQWVDRVNPDRTAVRGLVNVFGPIPYQDPYWNGNLAELKRVLEGIGLRPQVLFGLDSAGLDEWRSIPNAEFNVLVGAWAGLDIVEHLKEKYGTPFVHFDALPVGGRETTRFLREVQAFGEVDPGPVDAFIKKEEERFYAHIERTADFMLEFRYGLPRRFYSLLDASTALGFSRFLLNELGILPARQYVTDATPEAFQPAIRDQFAALSEYRSAEVVFETDAGLIHAQIRADEQKGRVLVLGSLWDRDLATDLGADILLLSVPVGHRLVLNCGYAGYLGGLRAIEDIYDRVLDTYR